ncbi:hypothetical protein ACLB2K_029349 [Fragaria x ananassa]
MEGPGQGNVGESRSRTVHAEGDLEVPGELKEVAFESAFSVGGGVLDQYRSALKSETVKALICTRDWIFAEKVDVHTLPPKLDDLTQDITKLSISGANSESLGCYIVAAHSS